MTFDYFKIWIGYVVCFSEKAKMVLKKTRNLVLTTLSALHLKSICSVLSIGICTESNFTVWRWQPKRLDFLNSAIFCVLSSKQNQHSTLYFLNIPLYIYYLRSKLRFFWQLVWPKYFIAGEIFVEFNGKNWSAMSSFEYSKCEDERSYLLFPPWVDFTHCKHPRLILALWIGHDLHDWAIVDVRSLKWSSSTSYVWRLSDIPSFTVVN